MDLTKIKCFLIGFTFSEKYIDSLFLSLHLGRELFRYSRLHQSRDGGRGSRHQELAWKSRVRRQNAYIADVYHVTNKSAKIHLKMTHRKHQGGNSDTSLILDLFYKEV